MYQLIQWCYLTWHLIERRDESHFDVNDKWLINQSRIPSVHESKAIIMVSSSHAFFFTFHKSESLYCFFKRQLFSFCLVVNCLWASCINVSCALPFTGYIRTVLPEWLSEFFNKRINRRIKIKTVMLWSHELQEEAFKPGSGGTEKKMHKLVLSVVFTAACWNYF